MKAAYQELLVTQLKPIPPLWKTEPADAGAAASQPAGRPPPPAR